MPCVSSRAGNRPTAVGTSLTTLIQMVEGGLGVTLLPGITLDAGILKGTRLVARPFSPRPPSRTLALVARRTSPRRADADLLAKFLLEESTAARDAPSSHSGVTRQRRNVS
jgi:LysR family hydrogen peroxide-inducible transcriptional activator